MPSAMGDATGDAPTFGMPSAVCDATGDVPALGILSAVGSATCDAHAYTVMHAESTYTEGRGTVAFSVPNSMGTEKAKSRCQTQTNSSHTRQALDTPKQVSQGDRPAGHRGQPQTNTAEGKGRPRNGARPDARGRAYKPDRTGPGTRCRGTGPRRAPGAPPEMKASRERPGPPACSTWSAKERSNVRAGAPRRPNDSTDRDMKGRPEDARR
jgi:hypothetical protein